MQKVSPAFLAAMGDAPYVARLTLDDTDIIQGDAIHSIDFSGGSSGDNSTITLGGTVAGSVTVLLDKADVSFAVKGRELSVELGIELESGTEWLPMGTYTVTDAVEDDGILTVTACDALSSKFDVEYKALEGFDFSSDDGVDDLAFLGALCARRGVKVDTSGLESIPLKSSPEGYTERQIIGFISALHGGFADIDRFGTLKIRWYAEVDKTVDTDAYYDSGMEKASYNFAVGWLKCYVEPMEETLTMGDENAEQGIYFECPWMGEDRLAEIWETAQNFTYRPVTELRFFGDPRLDPGDIITLEDCSGAVHAVPIMSVTHEYDGGIITQITAKGQAKTDAREGPVQRETKRLYSKILKKQNEIELSIRNLDGDKIISLINLSETEALIQAPKIKLEGLVTANSNFKILTDGSVEAANAVITGKITATEGKIGDCAIIGGKLQVPAANITGTLTASQIDVNNLKVKATNITGTLTASQINGDGLTANNATISGKITATSGAVGGWQITANGLYRSATDGQIRLIPAGNLSTNYTVNGYATTAWVMLCGPDNTTTANFGVTKAGKLYAKDANLSGTINATNGKIGNWTVSAYGYLEGSGGANTIRLYPKGVQYSGYTFYLVVYDSGGAVPIGGITASGWETL